MGDTEAHSPRLRSGLESVRTPNLALAGIGDQIRTQKLEVLVVRVVQRFPQRESGGIDEAEVFVADLKGP